jgi:carboxymethylenebutenolidase
MLPATNNGRGPGMLVLQEIFGVNGYIEDVACELARLGVVALAPDVFWRTQPGLELDDRDPESVRHGLDLGKRLDMRQAVVDLQAALAHLHALPEVAGQRVGTVGFCLGGTLAFLLATTDDADLDLCVSYYGAGVPGAIDRLEKTRCPVAFIFGELDPVIPAERVARVAEAVKDRPATELHIVAGGGHAFHNRNSAGYNAAAASSAWSTTERLITDYLLNA